MARHGSSNDSGVRAPNQLKTLLGFGLGLLLLAAPAPVEANWGYNCFSAGQTCRSNHVIGGSDSNTRAGGTGAASCKQIDSRGCNTFSFDGGGAWKLCQYTSTDCSVGLIDGGGPNGGVIRCTSVAGVHSYKVVAANTAC